MLFQSFWFEKFLSHIILYVGYGTYLISFYFIYLSEELLFLRKYVLSLLSVAKILL